MSYHKNLQKQINKLLTPKLQNDPDMQKFLNVVNETFENFERDIDILNHSFYESEKEFSDVNENLKLLIQQKTQSITNLLNSIKQINPETELSDEIDIVSVSRILNEELKKSKKLENLNKAILESALNAILYFNKEGQITYWNKEAEKIFGYTKKEAKHLQFYTLLSNECQIKFRQGINLYLSEKNEVVLNKILEAFGLTKLRNTIDIEMFIISIEQNNERMFCAFIQDITERKISELNLKIQEEKYRNIINNGNLGLVEVDNDDRVVFINQSFSNMSGYVLDDLKGKVLTEVLQSNQGLINNKKTLRKQGISDQYLIQIKDSLGNTRWWNISGSPRYDNKGNIVGSIGIHLDITNQKILEQKLIKAKEEAENNSHTKEAILTTMSHEIRTPLTGIIGMISDLSSKNKDTQLTRQINYSLLASNHLLSIVNNILDYSKIEAGQMVVNYESNYLNASIEKVMEILNPKAKEKNLTISFQSNQNRSLKFDALKLEQILFNVLGNAIKFTDTGHIEINCNSHHVSDNKFQVSLSIKDTGIGMDKEMIQELFEKYTQAQIGSNLKHKGTGLGMAITKELTHLMGGEIEVQSTPGKGTTFNLIFTFNEGDDLVSETHPKEQTLDLSHTQILVVDDNEMNRLVAENSLSPMGAQLDFAEDGDEALEKIFSKNFDLILLDLFLPKKNGTEVAYIVRNQYQNKVPIIGMSANINKKYIDDCKKAGMNDYILKPFTENELKSILKKHLTLNNIIYNLSSLETMSRGNDEFVQKMILIFIKNTQEAIEQLKKAIQSHNAEVIGGVIHKIKPSVGTLQIKNAMEIIQSLEKKLNSSEKLTTEDYDLIEQFTQILDEAQSQLSSLSKKWK